MINKSTLDGEVKLMCDCCGDHNSHDKQHDHKKEEQQHDHGHMHEQKESEVKKDSHEHGHKGNCC